MPIALLRNFPATVTSQMAIERLRELHYERAFESEKVPTAATFAYKSASTMDELLAFASIIRWLLERLGSKLQSFSEFDEPNAIALEIINACKPFVSSEELAPHDLREGSGDAVCALLLALAEAALEKLTIQDMVWKENEAEGALTDAHDEEDEDDEFVDDVYMASFEAGTGGVSANGEREITNTEIAPGVLDVHKWQEEQLQVEQALNATKYNSYVEDWRPDIERLTSLATELSQESQGITQELTVVSDGIGKQLERLIEREEFLNQQISSFSGKLIEVSRTHEGLQKESDEIQAEISVLNEELAETNEKFKKFKAEMTAENNRITDTSGLASAKAAIGMLSNEIRDLDLRIILAEQRLFGQPSQ